MLELILASTAVMGSPGPSTISVTAVGASFGMRRSVAYASGLITGTIAVLIAVSLGAIALIGLVPHGAAALGILSTVYILFLAFKIATAPPLSGAQSRIDAPSFTGGVLLAVANPKAYLAIGAVVSGTTIVARHPALDAVIKGVLLALMIVLIHAFWLVAGASLARLMRDPVGSRIVNVSLAAVLLVTVVALQWPR